MEGLDIDEKAFMKLKPAERDLLIYKNLKAYCDSQAKYKVHMKIQYWMIGMSLAGLGLLISIHL